MAIKSIDTKNITPQMWAAFARNYRTIDKTNLPDIFMKPILALLEAAPAVESARKHTDDIAVDKFAAAMKEKLAKKRDQGYGGWNDKEKCLTEHLQNLLLNHLSKGDPVDIGNFAMMLWNRGESVASLTLLQQRPRQNITQINCQGDE